MLSARRPWPQVGAVISSVCSATSALSFRRRLRARTGMSLFTIRGIGRALRELLLSCRSWGLILARIAPKLQVLGIDPSTLQHTHGIFNLLGFLAIAFCTIVLVIGIKESANFNSVIVIVKVAVLLVFIGIGAMFLFQHPQLTAANWHPFIPPSSGGEFGWAGISHGAAIIFFAYIGFDAVSTAAQEAKNPARDMPIGILGSLIICTILYVVTAGVLTGLVNYKSPHT